MQREDENYGELPDIINVCVNMISDPKQRTLPVQRHNNLRFNQ